MLKVDAKLVFDPPVVTKKHNKQSSWKYTAMLLLEDDTDKYYRWLIERRFGLKLNQPLRGSHITFINDRIEDNYDKIVEVAKFFNGKTASFEYDPSELRTNNTHWWLKVYSDDLLNFRELCGFTRNPYFGLHLTIGLANDRNLEHSEYIHRTILRYGL